MRQSLRSGYHPLLLIRHINTVFYNERAILSFFLYLTRKVHPPLYNLFYCNCVQRRIPITVGHCWGMALMRLTRCYPKIHNRDITDSFKKNKVEESKNAMFVANPCSWMDIPFLGAAMGQRNYKIVSNKELGVVPILGTVLYAG